MNMTVQTTPENNCMASENQNILEALQLLYDILQDSFHTTGTTLKTTINGNTETIQSLYWKCKDLIEQTNRNFEKTGFLTMSIIEQTYFNAKPLLLCKLEEILSKTCTMPEKAIRLEHILLAENPYKKIWAEKSNLYKQILTDIGFKTDDANFSDLTEIMDPLLNALSFYGNASSRKPKIYHVRFGKKSDNKHPEIARSICRYSSEKELVDAVMSCDKDSAILFGAVEKTNRQTTDWFNEWYNGYADERQRNTIKNEGISREEYLDSPCAHTRTIYTCVKSGYACWLIPMPYLRDNCSEIGADTYYYGKRASYAPYKIFVNEPAQAPEGTTLLTVPKKGYLLSDIMDHMATVWFPVFIEETINYFFRSDEEPKADLLLLCEEAVADLPAEYKSSDAKDYKTYDVVSYVSGPPDIPTYRYTIKQPNELNFEPWFLTLLHVLKISTADIKDIPILPVKHGNLETFDKLMDERMSKAYIKFAANKIADIMQGRWNVRQWLVDKIKTNINAIISHAEKGDFRSFTDVIINGAPILDENGIQKTTKSERYPYDTIPAVQHTSNDDCRTFYDIYKRMAPQVFWMSSKTTTKPPVVWKIRPSIPEHYAGLTGIDVEDLPDILKFSDLFLQFQNKYKRYLPSSIMDEYVAGYGYTYNEKSAYMPCMAPINLCMNKKTHNAISRNWK